jgi:CDP-glucose 4,6-dehydratase
MWKAALEGLAMNPSFWKGKRVFVTGHSGFKGTWLSMLLLELGAEVTGYSLLPPSSPCLSDLVGLHRLLNSIEGDVCEYQRMKRALEQFRPQIVIHMAAQSLVRRSYQDPLTTYSTNIMGTVNLLEALRHVEGIRAVVNVTSDKCYENRVTARGYREGEPLGGRDPYSSSKACAELITSAFRNSFFSSTTNGNSGIHLASARAGNVIGGGDWAADRLIPDMIRAFSKNEPVKIRNPKARRPWQHVLEPIMGYLKLTERLWSEQALYADAWNFGPSISAAKPVEWITQYVAKRWGHGAKWELDEVEHQHESLCLKLNSTKSRLRLGWSPSFNIRESLDWTISWYKRFYSGEDARAITLEQLHAFMKLSSTKVRAID